MIWSPLGRSRGSALPGSLLLWPGLVALAASPAQALPGLDIAAGLYYAYKWSGSAGSTVGADLDGYLGFPFVKTSVHLLSLGATSPGAVNIGEASLRVEPLPLPFVSLRPGLGYQGFLLPAAVQVPGASSLPAGTLIHGIYPSVTVGIGNIPVLPVSLEAEVGGGFPVSPVQALTTPLLAYSGTVNFPLPLLPVSLSGRYRGYQGPEWAPVVSAFEGGLRVAL